MKAIILAGGKGTRLKELVNDVPKPMAAVAGKPFLEYLILQLHGAGIDEIILSIGYMKDAIRSYFHNGGNCGARISYCEEDEPLGTGGAFKKAMMPINDETVLVMNGDSFLDADLNKLASYHKGKHALATIGLASVEDMGRYGMVELNDNGEVISFMEKTPCRRGLINGGIYILNREVVDYIPDGYVSLEKDVLPFLVNRGLYGVEVKGFFVDMGVPADYLDLNKNPQRLLSALGLRRH